MKTVEFFANIGEHERMRVLYVLRASLGSVGIALAEALESDRCAKVAGSEASVECNGCRPGSCVCALDQVVGGGKSFERNSAEGEDQ